jgi:ubiquinone/menaquinone biosynthesis C-methylase UbiE
MEPAAMHATQAVTDYCYVSADPAMYRGFYKFKGSSATLREIWKRVLQDDYPEDADPFGFTTRTDLLRIVRELEIGPGARFLDLGCGRGGPGLWVARETGADLIGMDLVEEAIAYAYQSTERFRLKSAATFVVGDFEDIRLPAAYLDGVMSLDCFWMVHNKPAALRQVARVLNTGARFVMTTWVSDREALAAMLQAAGFRILSLEETPRWKELQAAIYRRVLEQRRQIVAEIGQEAAQVLLSEAEHAPEMLERNYRVLASCECLGPGA